MSTRWNVVRLSHNTTVVHRLNPTYTCIHTIHATGLSCNIIWYPQMLSKTRCIRFLWFLRSHNTRAHRHTVLGGPAADPPKTASSHSRFESTRVSCAYFSAPLSWTIRPICQKTLAPERPWRFGDRVVGRRVAPAADLLRSAFLVRWTRGARGAMCSSSRPPGLPGRSPPADFVCPR